MGSYRIYFLNDQGHFLRAQEFEAASDEEALAKARETAVGERIELWNQARIVAQLDPVCPAA